MTSGAKEAKFDLDDLNLVAQEVESIYGKLISFRRKMSPVIDMRLSESDTCNSGNVQAGFGDGVLETGNKVWACDRGLELKATIEIY